MKLLPEWMRAIDEAPGGVAEVEEGEEIEATEEEAEETPAAPAAPALTPEDIEARSYAATQRAIADAQRATQEANLRANAPAPTWDPTAEAMDAMDIKEAMLDQVRELYPDMPAEAAREVRAQLRNFKTIDALRGAQAAKIHETLADAAMGKLHREGKIAPKGQATVRREPVHSEPEVRLTSSQAREVKELEDSLGIKFSKEEIAAHIGGR